VGIFTVLVMVLVSAGQPAFAAPAADSEYYPQTLHYIRGDFLKFYHSVSDPLTVFGFPINDEKIDPTGRLTQYFQRARFDLQTTAQGPVVTLAKLGYLLYDDNGTPYNIPQTGPTCRLFPKTGKTACYAFLQYYDANQGDKYFGDPISGLELRDGGRIVQYFTNVRMDYYPNLPEGRKVQLAYLGVTAFYKYVRDASSLWTRGKPEPGDASPIIRPITSLNARAFVHDPLLGSGLDQVVYLIVKDQDNQPVDGAEAYVTITNPDGTQNKISPAESTGSDGVLKISLPIGNFAPRQVVLIEVTAKFHNFQATADTWFRIWY